MNCLTQEQLLRIEKNKKAAELKRQQLSNGSNRMHVADNIRPTNMQVLSKTLKPKFHEQVYKNVSVNVSSKVEVCCYMVSKGRFAVRMAFNEAVIDVLRSVNGRVYDNTTREWSFPLSEHVTVLEKLTSFRGLLTVEPVPKSVLNAFVTPEPSIDVDISRIDGTLLQSLLPFQMDGVRFGISRKGRCLIADDMGLGKTLQALGISHYFVDKWPLLIVCPSSMRFPWEEAIHNFLPSVNPFHVVVMTSGHDVIHETEVVITSYELLKTCSGSFQKKKFGVIIFDESHFLKNMKSARTKAALELSPLAHHVILLSGTPALSRPIELYPQVHAIDPTCFKHFHEFGVRYCDGKKSRFGWDYSGSSNAIELELLLKRRFMIRRMKTEVMEQLPSKVRKVVVLHPRLVKAVSQQLQKFASQMIVQKGQEKRGTLLQYYCTTGTAKVPAICEYLEDKLETTKKMLVFAHHTHVLDSLCELLIDKRVDHIRIDGTTGAEARAQFCERFQTDPDCRVAVLSIKAANSGLTLTAAHLVLFAELYWNPGELTQAEDRAHRIGQQDSVVVEYLIAKGTADDYLWALVQSKLNVLNTVGLSKDNFKDSNTEELKDKTNHTLDSFVTRGSNGCGSKDELSLNDETSSNFLMDSALEKEFAEEAFGDDDVFSCIDLEKLENEHANDCKKQKLN